MTDNKKFAVEFNYLEMLGLHDYARFKNKSLKEVVLQALEKEITSDEQYFKSMLENKVDFLLAVIKPDLSVKSLDKPELENTGLQPEGKDKSLDLADSEAEEKTESEELTESEKKIRKIPKFLQDIPRQAKPKKKAKKKPVRAKKSVEAKAVSKKV